MKRMWSKNELKNIANAQVQEQVSGGQLENVKVFEEITDKDGHKRFIEGDIDVSSSYILNKLYGKWALSGTHLLIVLCVENTDETYNMPAGFLSDAINLPEWIKDKIVPIAGIEVDKYTSQWFGSDASTQTVSVYLEKTLGEVKIYTGGLAFNKARNCRISFDLLIDNE